MLALRHLQFSFQARLIVPRALFASHSPLCPTQKKEPPKKGFCPGAKRTDGDGTVKKCGIKRALQPGKVRLAFIPEEFFLFFHSKTGVTGPYVFLLVVGNYLVSKEIFVMEHEYYAGLSIIIILVFVVKKLGPAFANMLDEGVKEYQDEFENGRKAELALHENAIKDGKDAQNRAKGQKLLMDAKKENIAMQLEAAYRERYMLVYRTVKGRMDYHVKRHRAESRIHQKWMIDWILSNVHKSINADFEKQAMDAAIRELSTLSAKGGQ